MTSERTPLMTELTEGLTPLQAYQRALFLYIDKAAEALDPAELDALRQSVVMRIDRVADTALGEF